MAAAEDMTVADEDWDDLEHEVEWLGPQNALQPEQSGVGQHSELHQQKMEKVRPSALRALGQGAGTINSVAHPLFACADRRTFRALHLRA